MSTSEQRILIVDDDEYVLEGMVRVLRQEFEIVPAASGARGLSLLKEAGPFAVIVSDFHMPHMDGVSFLREAIGVSPESVPVMLTGHADLDLAIAAFQEARVYRFLLKPCPHHLLQMTLRDCLGQYHLAARERRLVAELRGANAALAERNRELTDLSRRLADLNVELDLLARVDSLTGLLNRRAWMEAVAMGMETARREGMLFGISLIDVDGFNRYNDGLGHAAGDKCLARVARTIRQACREGDACGRYGGEEFIVAGGYDDHDAAVRQAETIRRAVFDLGIPGPRPDELPVTVSIGCATDDQAEDWESLLRRADEALFTAKRGGRDSLRVAPAPTSAIR